MTPKKDQYVKCFMRTGMLIEGIVEEWSDAQIILRSLDDQSLMIIHCPNEDIMLTKIMLKNIEKSPVVPASQMQEKIKNKLYETQESADDPELQNKNIEELRQLVIEQDRQIIANKTKEHFGSAGAGQTTKYTNPLINGNKESKHGTTRFYKKPRPQ